MDEKLNVNCILRNTQIKPFIFHSYLVTVIFRQSAEIDAIH